MTYRLTFRIRRVHFDAIRNGFKLVEYRRASPYWDIRFGQARRILFYHDLEDVQAVFVCGKDTHRRNVVSILHGHFQELTGRLPSTQGLADLGDGFVWGAFLGAEI